MPLSSPASGDESPGAVAARLTGRAVTGLRPLSGSLAEAALDDGRTVIVKRAEDAEAARAEAAGLRWLAEADATPVPRVHGREEAWLVLDRVREGRPGREAALRFGRELAGLHAARRARVRGAAAGRSCGGVHRARPDAQRHRRRLARPGTPSTAYCRICAVRSTRARWTPGEAAVVERVCARLPGLAGPAEPPARLHGDLWNGNVLWGADGRVRLIDPAAHGGHRETDLAMLALFGCPLLDAVLEGYQDVAPLAAGWRARAGVHQLFPLLVHAVLFGRGYAGQALAAARSALSL
ncbi:fructosamine kinase family protein [Streptomyces albogriseolus]|nr:fructosamine kinase family protein [Streptomyces albogriseolus]